MANTNFKVQNGLEVGPAIVFAANGDIITAGNITTTGSGTIVSANGFGGLNPNQIYSGSSNVTVTSSHVNVAISNTNVASFGSSIIEFGVGLSVSGNLSVTGNLTTYGANSVVISDPMIYIGNDNTGDLLDLGFVASFTNGTYQHTGLVRDASDGIWKLFANVAAEPTTTVDFTNATYSNLKLGTVIGVATTAKYADLAENYAADAEYEPGTVVCFGGEAEVTLCNVDHCQKVAGVVSTDPAYLMNSDLAGTKAAVALQGRVPCKVVGPIQKGDMMVAAGNGHARAEANPKIGAVIGKALENFDGAEGVIEVVIGRI